MKTVLELKPRTHARQSLCDRERSGSISHDLLIERFSIKCRRAVTVRVITLVLVLRQSNENRSRTKTKESRPRITADERVEL